MRNKCKTFKIEIKYGMRRRRLEYVKATHKFQNYQKKSNI
jgi:hypothetical protein